MEITRSSILREVLTEKEDQLFRYSKHRAGLTPIEGYENHFEDLRKTCDLLREMLREAINTPQPPADWQMEIIKGNQPDITWADKQPMTPDEAVLRRRYRKAEGFRPEPVTYPGGEEDGTL